MNSLNSYYRSIYIRFDKHPYKSNLKSQKIRNDEDNKSEQSQETDLDDQYLKYYKDVLSNKREAKLLRKFHEEIIDSYSEQISYLASSTVKSYANIVSRFILYSPSIDSRDLAPFIRLKFDIPNTGGTLDTHLKGTVRKYYLCLKGFLKHVYTGEYTRLDPEGKTTTIVEVDSSQNIITPLEIVNAYVDLMNLKNVEDAVILHIMYSLGANPSTISLLTFDSIDENKNITYFDTKASKFMTIKLNEHLWGDILYLKDYKLKNGIKNNQTERTYMTKIRVREDFITSLTETGIFKRFARRFNENLCWFKWRPQSIIRASNKMKGTLKYKDSNQSISLMEDSIMFTS